MKNRDKPTRPGRLEWSHGCSKNSYGFNDSTPTDIDNHFFPI